MAHFMNSLQLQLNLRNFQGSKLVYKGVYRGVAGTRLQREIFKEEYI